MLIKRKIDQLLAKSNGMQLVWLMAVSALCLAVAMAVAYLVYDDGKVTWQTVVAIFLDPGCFGGPGDHDLFRLSLAVLSVFLFSALLVSVFTNMFENIREAAQNGARRYALRGHVLVVGADGRLESILRALAAEGRTAVVLAEERPEVDAAIDYVFYRGRRDVEADLASARPDLASAIYVIGGEGEEGHDDLNLKCLDLLTALTRKATHDIRLYMTIRDFTTTEVFQYLKDRPEGRLLLVDTINDSEYRAEQLLVDPARGFTPVLREGDRRQAHFIVIGTGAVAQAVAYTAAHICHYASYREAGVRTRITFVGEGMERWRDHMVASRPALFALSHYWLVRADGTVERHAPEGGDFLDVEWQFVDSHESSPLARRVMEEQADGATRVVVCHTDSRRAIEAALHLPRKVGAVARTAVYMPSSDRLIERAAATGMYGHIETFGRMDSTLGDPLFRRRSQCGQRVNYVYHRAYSPEVLSSAEEAWYAISEADKYSSVYCANAMPLRRVCFAMTGDRMAVYEAEHRRWMMSELIMGFAPGAATDKRRFIHADIVPFDDLTPEEQVKDKILIDAIDYILG